MNEEEILKKTKIPQWYPGHMNKARKEMAELFPEFRDHLLNIMSNGF